MATSRLQPLVLTPRHIRSTREQRWIGGVLMVAVLGAMAWTMFMLFDGVDPAKLGKLRESLLDFLASRPDFLLDVVAAGLMVWYLRRTSRYERLVLDETGIRYESPLPKVLRVLQPDWSLRWSQVRTARIGVPRLGSHPGLAMLELDAAPKPRKILVLHWVAEMAAAPDQGTWRDRFFAGAGTKRDLERTWKEIEESPLVRYAKQAGLAIAPDKTRGIGAGFSLESNRHALAGTLLVIALLGYAVVDLALSEEAYAVEPPLALFAVGGAIMVLAGLLWLGSAGVPRAETFGVALLLGGAFGFALYPGALRVNALTDSEGLRTYDYRLSAYVVFSPLDKSLPELQFPGDADYWRQFKLGTVHSFELRKGGLGFYQVDMAPVRAKMRAYFWSRS